MSMLVQLLLAAFCLSPQIGSAQSAGLSAAYSFSEGSGTTTADNSGNGNIGTLSNTTWSTAGKLGSALSFDGSSAHVSIADAASLGLTAGMTIEAWVYPTALGANRTVVYKQRSTGLSYALFASNPSSLPFVSIRIGTLTATATGTTPLPRNAWSHLAATYDGAALILFVNGTRVASRATSGNIQTSSAPLSIGSNPNSGSQYFQGMIDEVRIYAQARTQAQIQSDMTSPITGSGNPTCPCTLWSNSSTPTILADPDSNPVELGVKFSAGTSGSITAIRFYKSSTNTGPFVVNLWSQSGQRLATAQVNTVTASGWQQVPLPSPVPVAANTTYVASYHTGSGHYSADSGYFTGNLTSGPLTAPASGPAGGNGVYAYGAGGFPTQTYNANNYWVDVVFSSTKVVDTTPPVVISTTPASDANQVDARSTLSVTFSEPMQAASINASTIVLLDAGNNPVPASVSYDMASYTATLTPNAPLAGAATFTALVKGGSADPRVKDAAGNPMASDVSWSFTTAGLLPTQGPGGPVLVITSAANPFSTYYAEILRTEGFNLFQVADISTLSASVLSSYDVVILGQMSLTAAQVTMLSDWVNAGGSLIAMRPDKQLANLLGLSDAASTLTKGYLLIDTSRPPGRGLVGQTIQYQGTADRYTLNGATAVAMLYSNATTATSAPAVTVRNVGSSGGKAAAFTYDLARSVVYMRQGNPAWSGKERDGTAPIRSDDLFFGAAASDPQSDWIDLSRVAIPQADEQQRLLANLVLTMNQSRRLLPRFWYFPRGLPAVVVMTGDDHANGGTAGRFDNFKANSPAGCVVDNWECVRGTSYVYPGTPLSDAQAAAYTQQGFEIALHLNTNCADFTEASLDDAWISQLAQFGQQFPSLPSPNTNRTHCIAWSDYATEPQVELSHGVRFDTNYYYWPPSWVNDRPGFFTGSGMPMRLAKPSGEMVDVYHAVSQMTDESGQSYPYTIDTLLDGAVGPNAYYGAFTINAHTDKVASAEADAVIASARTHGVPIVSAKQMLRWLDGRNSSSFTGVNWNGSVLSFSVRPAAGARGLQVMVPVPPGMQVSSVTANGNAVSYGTAVVKGSTYAFVMAAAGAYQVTFTQTAAVLDPSLDSSPSSRNPAHWDTAGNGGSVPVPNPKVVRAGASGETVDIGRRTDQPRRSLDKMEGFSGHRLE
jgi:hypothetical protein